MAPMKGVILVFLLFLVYLICFGEDVKLPLGMSKELYCEGCEAAIKEMDKNLSKNAIDNVMVRIVEAMEAVCSPQILTSYKWSPPKMTKACLHFTSTYDEDLEERLYEQYKKPGKPKQPTAKFVDDICLEWTEACVNVNRSYEPDEDVDGPDGEGLAGREDADGIRTMNGGDDYDDDRQEYVSETEWETDDEGEEEETEGTDKLVPGAGGKKDRNGTAAKAPDDGKEILKRHKKNIIDDDSDDIKENKTEKIRKKAGKKAADDDDDEKKERKPKRKPNAPRGRIQPSEDTIMNEEDRKIRKEENYIDDDEDEKVIDPKDKGRAKDEL